MGEPDFTRSPRTEIVIATLAESRRSALLMRAIESILSQGAKAIVVINGDRFDPDLKQQLQQHHGVQLLCVPEPGFPNAVFRGQQAVTAQYFGFLDDDDYLLPGSIALREAYLDAHPSTDVVVANGLREEWIGEMRLFRRPADLKRISKDPLAALLRSNWMTPCGPLYRRATVQPDVFQDLAKYVEWTNVGLRLIGKYKVGFLFDNTFVQSDTPGSLSKQRGQARSALKFHRQMLGSIQTPRQMRLWNRRICNFSHQVADEELDAGHWFSATRYHIRSLTHAPTYGFPRYCLYTGKLMFWPITRLLPRGLFRLKQSSSAE